MNQTIEHIIQKCLLQDRAAQRLLYQQYCEVVMQACYRYASDINEAKDMVQNTFIRVFQHLEVYNPTLSSFATWISRIAVREAIALKRKKKKLDFNDDIFEKVEQSIVPEIIDKLEIEEVRVLIEKLPENHRIILNLYYFEEFSHQEIASMLGIEISSSRSKLTRAKAELNVQWKLNAN
jgi:RNA polymerase sigma factor (sigma-70 family)